MNNTSKESDFEAARTAIKHSFANIRNKSIIISIQKIASFKCYYGGCLQLKMSITDVMKFIKPIHEMIRTLNKTEKSQYLRDKIRSCLVFKEGYKNAICCWKIGEAPDKVISGVCRDCFTSMYEIGLTKLKLYVKEIKNRVCSPCLESFVDKSKPPSICELRQVQHHLTTYAGHSLSNSQKIALLCPDTALARASCTWMNKYFGLIGDYQPNKLEIHLEPVDKLAVSMQCYSCFS